MTTTDTGWETHAAGLVAALTNSGDLRDPAWAAAIAAIPRHRLVPTAYQQQPDGSWAEIDTSGRVVSSSTKPDLMVRMLETLDIHPGHRVLVQRRISSLGDHAALRSLAS